MNKVKGACKSSGKSNIDNKYRVYLWLVSSKVYLNLLRSRWVTKEKFTSLYFICSRDKPGAHTRFHNKYAKRHRAAYPVIRWAAHYISSLAGSSWVLS